MSLEVRPCIHCGANSFESFDWVCGACVVDDWNQEPYDTWMKHGLDDMLRGIWKTTSRMEYPGEPEFPEGALKVLTDYYKEERMQYEYICSKCGTTTTEFKPVAERHNAPSCDECNYETELAISTVAHPVMNPARPVKKARSA